MKRIVRSDFFSQVIISSITRLAAAVITYGHVLVGLVGHDIYSLFVCSGEERIEHERV